jgi:hypothetical protein
MLELLIVSRTIQIKDKIVVSIYVFDLFPCPTRIHVCMCYLTCSRISLELLPRVQSKIVRDMAKYEWSLLTMKEMEVVY